MKFRSGRSSRIMDLSWDGMRYRTTQVQAAAIPRSARLFRVPQPRPMLRTYRQLPTRRSVATSSLIFPSWSSCPRRRPRGPVRARRCHHALYSSPTKAARSSALRRNTAARTLRACRPSGCRGTPSTGEHPPLHLRWSVRPTAPVCLRPSPAVAGCGVAGEMAGEMVRGDGTPTLVGPIRRYSGGCPIWPTRVGVPSGRHLAANSGGCPIWPPSGRQLGWVSHLAALSNHLYHPFEIRHTAFRPHTDYR